MIDFFIDPVLRGPTLGTLFMCLALALMGVILFFQRRSLVGEVLSHASYPGVILGLMFFQSPFLVLVGAFLFALLAYWLLQRGGHEEGSMTLILSSFFGFGILLVSLLQFSFGPLAKLAESYLFGQAATMIDDHIYLFGILAAVVVLFISLFFKEIQVILFDRQFAKSINIPVVWIETGVVFLVLITFVSAIRSVGVVLLSGALVAPTVAARMLTQKLGSCFLVAGCFGMLSAITGNVLSVHWSGPGLVFPTGPMIVITASLIALLTILFAPKKGLCFRFFRQAAFRLKCHRENLLKFLWKHPKTALSSIREEFEMSRCLFALLLFWCRYQGWVDKRFLLTDDGREKAKQVVRLHRLWEVYLVEYVGRGTKEVHESAEEMEHVLTPHFEKELVKLLNNPTMDPHKQPIPSQKETL